MGRALVVRARFAHARLKYIPALHDALRGWRTAGAVGIGAAAVEFTRQLTCKVVAPNGQQRPLRDNPLLAEHVRSTEARAARREFSNYSLRDRVRLRFPRESSDPERQGDLVILKDADRATGEHGVLLLNYTEGVRRFAAIFDIASLARHYTFVLEPSWWGYQDTTFLMFAGADADVLIECPAQNDYDFISKLNLNLTATRIGAGDWVDPDLFQAGKSGNRRYDVVMVSSWNPVKRHGDLFRALRAIKTRHGRELRVALIGYPAGWTRAQVEQLATKYGVIGMCDFYERISPEEVADIVGDARAYVLLSRTEGANRALYEAFFCDTPALVYRYHRGVNTDHVTACTGVLFEDDGLADAILDLLDSGQRSSPRAWALQNTGYRNSTVALNEALRSMALRQGRPWTRDIVAKKNAPNAVYAERGVFRQFEAEYHRLAAFLIKSE